MSIMIYLFQNLGDIVCNNATFINLKVWKIVFSDFKEVIIISLNADFLSELRFRNPIENIASSYVNLKRFGNVMKGLCPFHNEKTPSFTIYPETGSYYCFGCQNGGDVVTFIRNIENLDYVESVKYLAERSGVNLPEQGFDDSVTKLKRTLLEINRSTAMFYHKCLFNKEIGQNGLKYLSQRGLNVQTIKHFGLGFAPDSWNSLCDHLKKQGFSESDMIIANVAGKNKNGRAYDRFRGKIMFPIIDLRGNVIGFGGRKLPNEDGAKYINTSDTPVYKKSKNLFALNLAKNHSSEMVILCEGYMDVIALHQAGFSNAIAALGTSFTQEQASLLSRYTKEIVVTMDSDEAGKRATERVIGILNKTGLKVRVLQLDEGKDPDDYIKEYGAERFKLVLEGAKNDIEFRLLKAKAKFDVETSDGKIQYLREAVDVLASINNEIAENIYAGRLSIDLNVDKNVLLNQIKRQRIKNNKTNVKKQLRELTTPKLSKNQVNPLSTKLTRATVAEETILSLLMLKPKLLEHLTNASNDIFITDFNKKLFNTLLNATSNLNDFNITMLSGDYSPEEMSEVVRIQNKEILNDKPKETIIDCMKVLKDEKDKQEKLDFDNMDNSEFAAILKKISINKTAEIKEGKDH